MLSHLIHVQYCYDFLVNQIPMGLLVYTHIPTAIVALAFGIFLIYKDRSLPSVTLFIVCVAFALWCFLDISTWFAFLGIKNTMFTWSLLDLIGLIFFFFAYYFLYSFITKQDLPWVQKVIGLLLIAPTAIWTFLGYNLTGFDGNYCEAIENESFTSYFFYAAAAFLLAAIVLTIVKYIKAKDRQMKKYTALAGLGVIVFLGFFYSALLLVNLLVESSASTYAYNFEIYGLFGMPILLVYLGRLIVRYRAFNLKLFGSQLLVLALIVLIGSQYAFLQKTSNIILNSGTLILALIFGGNLIRSVRREIQQRERLEELSHKLEESNEKLKALDKLKTEFVSLVSHQLRSPLTAIKGYASMLIEGSFGKMADEQDTAVKRVYTSAQGLSNMVEDFLNISKIEQGGMKFEFMPVELSKVVKTLVDEMKIPAQSKGLELRMNIPAEEFNVTADPTKIKQVFLNLVDNSIKYTQKGFVEVGLQKEGTNVLFYVKDSGMGFDQETRAKLFQKFARGTDGGKVNTGGSGLGLYLAQQIARAHKGDVDAISEGPGKGAIFKVLIPMAK